MSKKEQPEDKRGGPRSRAGYLQQELVCLRKMIKWSTPTTRKDTIQDTTNPGLNDGEKISTRTKNTLKII